MVVSNKMFEDYETSMAAGKKLARPREEERVVISGMAGSFPESADVEELQENLFNKVDMITDDNRRWSVLHPEIPHRTGKIPVLNKFDASFFGIHHQQANTMDPMCRLLLEKAYEAIIDAGMNPDELRGTKTGVFIGACYTESEKTWLYQELDTNGFAVTGCVRSMLANRITYYLGFDGPSLTVDTACSSSMYAFEYAYRAIREGLCDAAIVGGCNLCLTPSVSLQFSRLGVLSMDGRCKCFDRDANGYCRSEAMCAVFLQKKKDAKRIYASVIHAKTNCDGFKEEGITYPSGAIQQVLFKNFYTECEVDPSTLDYIEAHGTGTKVGDPEEISALVKTFCEGRSSPLKIGSVKSNLGHTEPVSGLCSIAKVIIAMETGLIPPNINLNNLRTDVKAFHDGSIKVITDVTPWEGGLAGINSFGFGGANCHVLLKWNEKSKVDGGRPADDIPRLLNVSGRTPKAVDKIIKKIEKKPLDVELCKLLHEIYKKNIQGYNYRGFVVLEKSDSKTPSKLSQDIQVFEKKKPLYFYFPGLFTDFKLLDKSLVDIPAFSNAISLLSKTLAFDVFEVLSDSNKNGNNKIVHNFITVTAVQIAMIDVFKSIGVVPDKIVGSSIGEIACAYADGCITAEEAILSSYYIALSLQELDFSPHVMVHIEMPCLEVQKMVLNEIEVSFVCPKTSTAVGPKSLIKELTEKLKKKKIKVNLLNTFEKPMHSKSLKNAMKKMFLRLKQIIHSNKSASKWISCVSSDQFDSEYFCTNILDALRFEGVTKYAEQAFILEVGPSGTHHLSDLMSMKVFDENFKNYSSSLVTSLGKLYVQGVDMDLSKLYPVVPFPVSRSTPMISPFLSWDHSEDWFILSYDDERKQSGEKNFTINLNDEEMEFISGHVIDGRNLYPATGYLALVWDLIGNNSGKHFSEVPVIFENVKFLRATTLSKERNVLLTVLIQKSSGYFEVNEAGTAIVTGKVSVPNDISEEISHLKCEKGVKSFPLSSKDFYKELRLRGYNYKGLFKSVSKANVLECEGAIKWQENWVAFMDNMLQMRIILTDTRGLFVPTSLDRVVIDPNKHLQFIESLGKNGEIPVVVYKDIDMIKSGGIEIYGLKANSIPRRKNLGEPVLEKYHFIPNESNEYNIRQVVRIMVQTALENESGVHVKVVEVPSENTILSPIIFEVLGDLPLIQPEITVLTTPNNPLVEGISPEILVEDKKYPSDGSSAMIVIASDVLNDGKRTELESCLNAIKDGGYLIAREKTPSTVSSNLLKEIQLFTVDDEKIILLRKINNETLNVNNAVIEVTRQHLNWLPKAQEAMKNEQFKRVYFVSQNDKLSGIIGLVNCIRKEPGGIKARCIFTFDENVPKFSLNSNFYVEQLSKDLSVNVYKNGKWGTYRHLQLEMSKEIQAEYVYANTLIRGDVSSITWLQANEEELTKKGDMIVDVHYSALNFRDVMLSTGKLAAEVINKDRLKQDCVVGFEFSGVVNGKRVMGLTDSKGLSSKVLLRENFWWEVPDDWTLEDAATVPCVYLTTIYGLLMTGNLKEGESILIHSGTGGIGQAALNIALSYGCTVFTTVGTSEKKRFLLENFPQLCEKNIGNSHDTSFEEMIMTETNGRGVDMVLNSLAEEKLLASVRCLANNGRFIEIGKFDISNNNAIGMELYKRGASFSGVMLDNHFDRNDVSFQEKLGCDLLREEFKRGSVKPLVRTVFKKEEVEQAFRYMAAGKHMGKILIKINEERGPLAKAPLYNCKPRFCANMSGSYIITGGLGGFGLELADWLVLRGARNLILVSRKGVSNGYQDMRINIWKSYGVKVLISTADITKAEGVLFLLKEAESLSPVKGIFNLAVVLRDGIFGNQTFETFKDSIGPKADSTVYLDQYSRKMCPKLEHFVVFSSVSCGRGNGGQTNYGWSNSVMERVCESRSEEGFPATAVQWGAIGDAGLVAEMQDEHIEIVIGGTLQQRINSCLEVLDGFLSQRNAIVSSMVVAEKSLGCSSSDNIIESVTNILGMKDLKNVSQHSTLAELGMDSMMAVEIKQTLERNFEVFLSPQEIRTLTFAKLWDLSSNKTEEPTQNKDSIPENPPAFDLNLMITIIGKEQNKEPIKQVRTCLDKSPNNQVFIAPGIEGEAGVLDILSQHIESNVQVLQFNSTKCETVEDVANFLLPKILSRLKGGSAFNLVGYSWGGLPILEIAQKLEKLKYTGKICLVDSSPDLMRGLYNGWIAGGKDGQQKSIILRTVDILCPQERKKVEKLLEDKSDWSDLLKVFLDWSKNFITHIPTNVLESILNGIYSRIQAIHKLQEMPTKCLDSPIQLLRPKEITLPGEEDYGLSKLTNGSVTVKYCEGNHLTIIKQKSTAIAINSFMGFEDVENKTPILNGNCSIIFKENSKGI